MGDVLVGRQRVAFFVAQGEEKITAQPLANRRKHVLMIDLHFVAKLLHGHRPVDGDGESEIVRAHDVKLHGHPLT
jgi:hypothetical protein